MAGARGFESLDSKLKEVALTQPEWDALAGEVRELAQRVARIEEAMGMAPRAAAVATTQEVVVPAFEAGALLPALGRALLALAGAYLLRAVAESGSVGPAIGVAAGLIYAIFWLAWAARTPAERKLDAALHSLTSVLILAPLLWEATLRLHAVSPAMAAGILLSFTLFGLAISWRKNLLVVATIATIAGLGTASALLIATHDVLPFTFVILAIAAAVEACACLDHWLSERWLAAAAADLAVVLTTWLVTNPRGLPPDYAPIPHLWVVMAQGALLAVYLGSTSIRTLVRGFRFTGFETAQLVLVFAIGIHSGLAAVVAACGVACYPIAAMSRERNFHTYAALAIVLTVAGSSMLMPAGVCSGLWLLAAVTCWWMARDRVTFQAHGVVYLLLALGLSGALMQAGVLLTSAGVWSGEGAGQLAAGAVAASICYWTARRHPSALAVRFGAVASVAWVTAGLAAGLATAAYHQVFGATASHAYCATLRTAVVSVAALLVAWAGARWQAVELSRLMYPAMALGAYRLLTDDLHQNEKAALFLSLLVYGGALIALPRLRKTRATA